jgi:hypothetical protein
MRRWRSWKFVQPPYGGNEGENCMRIWKQSNLIGFLAILAIVSALVACDDGNDTWGNPPEALVGTWKASGLVPVELVINADGSGSNADEPAEWQVKGSELKMDYSGHESIVKWSISGSQLTLSNPDDMATLGAGGLVLVTYSTFTKQSGSTGGTEPNTPNPGHGDDEEEDTPITTS